MPYGICDSSRTSRRQGQQCDRIQAGGVDHRLEIEDRSLETKVTHASVGKAHATAIVADMEVVCRPHVDPAAPQWILPLVLEVSEPAEDSHERRSLAARGVGDADVIGCLAEADVLFHRG